MNFNQNIGLALSGGGVRGIAHLGVLKALEEIGIRPSRVSGTSAGAIVGALYCQGLKPDAILDIIISTNYFKFLRPAISWTGILKMDTLEQLFEVHLPENTFESLEIPLTITATEISRGKVVYFSQGELIKPLMASCCIPGIFDPIKIGDKFYIDGGALNNLPVEPLEGHCEDIIGVNCNHLHEEDNISNMKRLIERTVIMSMNYNVYTRKNKCDFFIEPQGLARYGVFDIKKAADIFAAGYESAQRFITYNEGLLKLGEVNQ
ncbi:patatin-like phospholipase family protein [Echinicola vietnamensis]|uniref:Putative esterase of the alpha-beta hydrolase superfamily n=1 Tax=Echinicola vietnamensis (strain DSM 17526 / LMG 23754 / KMM 6221) TaxID=926556 RepID=L0G234_ECHVK|nr:patatin-like phospholipase family protein [Echinicola vietnamensis]AGA79582.1 putative esterase of the alpha-beta hydrolase superfamily [Echinicola vietnamensis DSM 17526]